MRASLAALPLLLALGAPVVPAVAGAQASPSYPAHAEIAPDRLQIGTRATYRGWVVVPFGVPAQWQTPRSDEMFTWGAAHATRVAWTGEASSHHVVAESVKVEVPLQIFATGDVAVPGLGLTIRDGRGTTRSQLPTVRVLVEPVLTAADSNADLHALRGPLGAPWWERVPWIWVAVGALVLAALIALIVRLRRRRPQPAAATAAAPKRVRDPSAEALAELAALRRLHLPESGRFAEHAFQLTRILRRYLEATAGVTRPGHTTPELLVQLAEARLQPGALPKLEGLLHLWDRIKFARAESSVDEAQGAERETEALLRRPAAEAPRRVA
ncbi:MAG TPA: DUF4381 family protein [Candidatus Saccharimonadaceae bacterium]|nr:DUF4381 family protein [Candidatus Saccharimonadaceae bacterium]